MKPTVALLFLETFLAAATIRVPADYKRIQDGIDAAASGDTVLVSAGKYRISEPIDFNGLHTSDDPERSAVKNISVRGEGADRTIICLVERGTRKRVVSFTHGEGKASVLQGFTITRDKSVISDGGVYCRNSSPQLIGCIITGNNAIEGGGIYCDNASPRITGCTITGNSAASSGGGVSCNWRSSPQFAGCTIAGNKAEEGGGVFCGGSASPRFAGCTISGNEGEEGGGLFCDNAAPKFIKCRIVDNGSTISLGGGICCTGNAFPALTGCIVTGNAGRLGGGMYCDNSSPTLTNCTIAGNCAVKMGGFYCIASSPVLTSCIVWSNAGGSFQAEDRYSQPEVSFSCIEGENVLPGAGNSNADPLFAGWRDKEVHVDSRKAFEKALSGFSLSLSTASPCIGAGKDNTTMGADTGTVEVDGQESMLLTLSAGTYNMEGYNLIHNVSIEGAGAEATVIEGTVHGLRTGRALCRVTVKGGTEGGVIVSSGESPAISQCTITGNKALNGGGVCFGEHSSPTLTGCTITANTASAGGGIYCGNASPRFLDSTIRGNTADEGGGVYCDKKASPRFTKCTIAGNEAQKGAGMYCRKESRPRLDSCSITGNRAKLYGALFFGESSSGDLAKCIITGNTADSGGGVYCENASPGLTGCVIKQNEAGEGGGVFCRWTAAPELSNCEISENRAKQGGGVFCREKSVPHLAGCTISGNEGEEGGGIFCENASPRLADCMIKENHADKGGGLGSREGASPELANCTLVANWAVRGGGVYSLASSPVLTSCIVWSNAGESVYREDEDGDEAAAPRVSFSCIEGEDVWPGEGNTNKDPLFCGWKEKEVQVSSQKAFEAALTGFSFALSSRSPCIGAGKNNTIMGADTGTCDRGGNGSRLITLAAGTYNIEEFDLLYNVSIQGAGQGATVIEGVVRGLRTGVTLSHVTVKGGNEGGIVVGYGERPEISHCMITGNTEDDCEDLFFPPESMEEYGISGVFCSERSSPKLTDCMISRYRYGVFCKEHSSAELTRCTLTKNTECGICCYGASPQLNDCTITENEDGGVWCENASPHLANCRITKNRARRGAGVWCKEAASPVLTNCTITGNRAVRGGGVFCGTSPPVLTSCIVWNNEGGSFYVIDEYGEKAAAPRVSFSCIEGEDVWPGEGNTNKDPLFCGWKKREVQVSSQKAFEAALTGFSFALSPRSPCIGAGKDNTTMGADTGICDLDGNGSRLITLAAGTYNMEGFDLLYNVSIQGAGRETTVIEGTVKGLRTGAGLSNVTVTGGTESGIVVGYGEGPEISQCMIRGNKGYRGGGIFCGECAFAKVNNCTITKNNGKEGGGVFCEKGSEPQFTGCTVSENRAYSGGGIGGADFSPKLNNCTITQNRALYGGGGIDCGDASPVLNGCLIHRNRAKKGGGIYCAYTNSSPQFTNSIISENESQEGGGGVYCGERTSPKLTNCTIAGNVAVTGGGLFSEASTAVLTNCIVWSNLGGSLTAEPGEDLEITFSCVEGKKVLPGAGNTNKDPLFYGWKEKEVQVSSQKAFEAALMTGFSLALSSRSPCIGTGKGNTTMGADTGVVEDAGNRNPLIILAAGTYTIDGFDLLYNVRIQGAGPAATLIEGTVYGLKTGAELSRVTVTGGSEGGIVVDDGQAPRISQCVITGNTAEQGGGVICRGDSSPKLTDCTITGNAAEIGGAVYCIKSSPVLVNCAITHNRSRGVCCERNSRPTFRNCTIMANSRSGISCMRSDPELMGCTIADNSGIGAYCFDHSAPRLTGCRISRNHGGGLNCRSSSLVLAGCVITENVDRYYGGGISCSESTLRLSDCTIKGNEAGTRGGALYCGKETTVSLTNCTIVGNMASTGGGVYCYDASPELTSCILWSNPGGSLYTTYQAQPKVAYSCIEGEEVWPGTGNINTNPLFRGWPRKEVTVATQGGLEQALSEFSLSLSSRSPCIRAGQYYTTMGADTGTCDGAVHDALLVSLSAGRYKIRGPNLACNVSIKGAGEEATVIEAPVQGLKTGATLSHVTVTGGTEGGIIVNYGEAPRISQCTITGNKNVHGGGVYCAMRSSPKLTNCTITGNSAACDGGGVCCYESCAVLTDCTIMGNKAGADGGGVSCRGTLSPRVISCTITGNSAAYNGGGVDCSGSSPKLTNCLLTGNMAIDSGGGVICQHDSSPRLTNCTIARNVAVTGGGVMSYSSPELLNCIVWNNRGGGFSVWPEDSSPKVLFSCIQGYEVVPAGAGTINADPLFVQPGQPAGNGVPAERAPSADYSLQKNSPCIDAGRLSGAPAADIEGTPRPRGEGVDMGAYEMGG